MSLIVSVFAAALLCLLFYFFVKYNRNDPWAIGALFFKIASGIVLGFIYKFYYGGGDTFQYFNDAGIIARYLIENPSNAIHIFFDTLNFNAISEQISYTDQPRALFFAKIVVVFYLLTGGNYWLIGVFLSFISFLCAHILVKELILGFKDIRVPAMVSFYFLPTFVFWTSGLLKESLAIASLLVLVSIHLKIIRLREFRNISHWIVMIAAAVLLWQLKYFYAAVALPVLFALFMHELINAYTKIPAFTIVLFFIAGVAIASLLHYNLSFHHVADVVYQNYAMDVERSDSGSFKFIQFDGTFKSYIMNLPLAVVYGLFRPLAFEAGNILQLLVGMENSMVLILFIFSIWNMRETQMCNGRFLWAAVLFILLLDVFLAFSTPNFGTLSRYKVAYWPFFVMLVSIGLKRGPDFKRHHRFTIKKSGPERA